MSIKHCLLPLLGLFLCLACASALAEAPAALPIDLTGGAVGVTRIPAFKLFGMELKDNMHVYYLYLAFAVILGIMPL